MSICSICVLSFRIPLYLKINQPMLLNFIAIESIVAGYQDFVPEYNRRNKENKGYELFSDVMQRASRWITSQQSVRFTNTATINVKVKKRK